MAATTTAVMTNAIDSINNKTSPSPPATPGSPIDTTYRHQKTDSLEHCIRERHSIRHFLPETVPSEVLHEALALAQLAPSNSNIQPWKVYVASGAAKDRVRDALMKEAHTHGPNIAPIPEQFRHFRSEMGHELYGPNGYDIKRSDNEARVKATLRNYEFFGAPVVGVICMHESLSPVDTLSVGMYLQTLLLALTENGLGTCVEVSVAGYPEVLRREMGIGEDFTVLCGLAIGYPDPKSKLNKLVIKRQDVEKNVTFLET